MKKIIIIITILLILELNIVQCQILSYEDKLELIKLYLITKEIDFIEHFYLNLNYQYFNSMLYSMDSQEQLYEFLDKLYQEYHKFT